MTMVLPSPYDVVDTHLCQQQLHYSSTAAVYGGGIETIRRHHNHRSTSSSSPASDNNSQSDEMADDLIRPDNNQPNDSWLRLRLGSDDDQSSTPDRRRRGLVELDLLPGTTGSQSQLQQQVIINTRPSGFFHSPEFRVPPLPVALQRIPAPEMNWALMRPSNVMSGHQQLGGNYYHMANPASMSLMPMGPNFFARPTYGGTQMGLNGGEMCVEGGGGGGGGMQIIRPPRRPHVGVWFMLQASLDQVREPFLPQIPKSYLRIKNGRMTVRLLIKYLVQKLGLESESEVEIRCRGQELQPILTLQHVRDSIWCTRRDMPLTLLTDSPSSSTTLPSAIAADSHIMILHYARPLLSATAAAPTSSAPIY